MKNINYGRCEKCGVLLPLKYLREIDGQKLCYSCWHRQLKGGENNGKNFS